MSSTVARGADWTLAVVLTVAQALASLIVAGASLMLVMITDSCGGSAGEGALICSDGGVLFGILGIGAGWVLLAGGVITSIVLLVRAGVKGRRAWTAPLIGTGVGLLGIVAMVLTVVIGTAGAS